VSFEVTAESVAAPGLISGLWAELEKLGPITVLAAPGAARPTVGTWQIEIQTTATAEEIGSVFIFAVDAQPKIEPASAQETVAAQPAKPTEPVIVAPTTAPAAPAMRRGIAADAKHDLLRVSSDKIDRLVNLVGELVILRSQVSDACTHLADVPPVLRDAAEGMERLSAELRDVVLNVRMMPVRESFAKFKRLVRDLSRDLGKEVELVLEGEETEMDKSMLEQLHDPLLHMIRNALDHGIEAPDVRERAGKSRSGQLRLTAEQNGDRVCITVGDDGRGLDPEAIRAKAIAQGLLTPTATPTEAELFQLVFLPGFSTAKAVSQTSGRGVGMDVVKKRIELMRGSVTLTSAPGQGTKVVLSLPLTLAIIEGLMVGLGDERYVMPLSLVREIVERPALSSEVGTGGSPVHGRAGRASLPPGMGPNFVELRGKPIAVVDLRELFSLPKTPHAVERIIVAEIDGASVGLAVDAVLGSHQTVLKSLGWVARHVRAFSGATITGDGRVALILDVNALLALASASATPTPA
jgi:two-component system chemotaxis sensor kinase CheA